jgi:hypothetical protein
MTSPEAVIIARAIFSICYENKLDIPNDVRRQLERIAEIGD